MRLLIVECLNRRGSGMERMSNISWRDLLGDYPTMRPNESHGLQDALRNEGVDIPSAAHRALADCRTALAVMRAVVGK